MLSFGLLAAACGSGSASTLPSVSSSSRSATVSATSSREPSSSSSSVEPTVEPTTEPSPAPELPAGLPASYDEDAAARDVPPEALAPPGVDVTDAIVAATSSGESIVVMWTVPSDDPFRTATGWAAWRRFPDPPTWRPVLGRAHAPEDGVLGVAALAADVTGDGSEDAVLFEATGGSGACGNYLVADLADGVVVFSRSLCDGRVDPSSDPVGLTLTRSVFLEGDPHCCPSKTKTSVLTYAGARSWDVASSEVVRNAP